MSAQSSASQGAGPFTARAVGVMTAIALFGFSAVMTLAAFSDELAPRDRAGSTPYSKAATGYGGFVELLERLGRTVRVSRVERAIEARDQGLMILTLEPFGMSDLAERDIQWPALMVLPKWSGSPNPARPTWQADTQMISPALAAGPLGWFDDRAEVWRIRAPAKIETPFGRRKLGLEDDLQVIRSDYFEPVIETAAGAILVKEPYRDVYILSDPDMFNTFGLSSPETARFAVDLVDYVTAYSGETVIFDATLHGFVRSENMLQMMLSIPFLGATLCALSAAGLLGWAASLRFGAPEREDRAIALGKQALADNTAALVLMARRETKLAPGYLALTRRHAAEAVGAPKTLTEAELSDLFDRMGEAAGAQGRFSELADPLKSPSGSPGELVRLSRAIHRWRKETTHGRE